MNDKPTTCIEDDHDYTVLNVRLMNGHQNPIVTCENCDTVWHNHTPAHHGDLIVIPTNQPPSPEHLAAISDLAQRTGVMLLFVDPVQHMATATVWLNEQNQIRAVTGCDEHTAAAAQTLSKVKGHDHDTFIKALIETASTDPYALARSLPTPDRSREDDPSTTKEPTHNVGGFLPTGTGLAFNNSGCVERIATHNPDQDTQ